jgi:hypothetical protein
MRLLTPTYIAFFFALAGSVHSIERLNVYAQQPTDQPRPSPCKYEKLWVDPAADGSPAGREFVHKLIDALHESGAVEVVDKRKDAEAIFEDQVVSEKIAPSDNPNINCTNSKSTTDCYSDNYRAHADQSGVSIIYTGPASKSYRWMLFDRKTYLTLNSRSNISIDFKHPKVVAAEILKNLGCTVPASAKNVPDR